LKPYLSVGKKKKKGFKSKVVGEVKTSLHDESLTKPQVDFLDAHYEGVCNEADKTTTFDTSLELSYEASVTNAYDGHVDSTYDVFFR